MNDKHEMTAREFLQTMKRMCYEHGGCGACPMQKAVGPKTTCASWRIHHPDEAIAIVKKWAEEHPEKTRKTYKEDYLEKFPNVQMRFDAEHTMSRPVGCRMNIYGIEGLCTGRNCFSCWNVEMEDADE